MVSSILLANCRTASSTSVTAAAVFRSLGSGYSRITSFVMEVMRAISCFWLKNVAKVPPLLNLMPVLAARTASVNGKNGRYVPVFDDGSAVYQSARHHKAGDARERIECKVIN